MLKLGELMISDPSLQFILPLLIHHLSYTTSSNIRWPMSRTIRIKEPSLSYQDRIASSPSHHRYWITRDLDIIRMYDLVIRLIITNIKITYAFRMMHNQRSTDIILELPTMNCLNSPMLRFQRWNWTTPTRVWVYNKHQH